MRHENKILLEKRLSFMLSIPGPIEGRSQSGIALVFVCKDPVV